MLVLIQVSSMKTSLFGSRLCCHLRQRWRRRVTSALACSRANIVFFEAQSLAAQETPDRIMRDGDPARRQFRLQPMQRQVGVLPDPLGDESAVAVPEPACGDRPSGPAQPSPSPDAAATTSPPRTRQPQTAPQHCGSSHRPERLQPPARADHSKEVGPSDAGLRPASILNHNPTPNEIPNDSTKKGNALGGVDGLGCYRLRADSQTG